MDCSPPGSSVHGILQARILEWAAMLSSRGSSWPRDQTRGSCTASGFFTAEPPGKPMWNIAQLKNTNEKSKFRPSSATIPGMVNQSLQLQSHPFITSCPFFFQPYGGGNGLPCWLNRKRICLQCRRCGFDSWVGKIPWRRKWQPTPVFLPGESHGQRSLVGCSPRGHKESDTTEQLNHHWWLKELQQFWGPGPLRSTSSGREQKQTGYLRDALTPQVREKLKRGLVCSHFQLTMV